MVAHKGPDFSRITANLAATKVAGAAVLDAPQYTQSVYRGSTFDLSDLKAVDEIEKAQKGGMGQSAVATTNSVHMADEEKIAKDRKDAEARQALSLMDRNLELAFDSYYETAASVSTEEQFRLGELDIEQTSNTTDYQVAAAEVTRILDENEAKGIYTPTVTDVLDPNSDVEWRALGITEDRALMGDRINGYYVLDKENNKIAFPPEYNKIINDLRDKNPHWVIASDVSPGFAANLNSALIAKWQTLDSYGNTEREIWEHEHHAEIIDQSIQYIDSLRSRTDLDSKTKTALIEKEEQRLRNIQAADKYGDIHNPKSTFHKLSPQDRATINDINNSNLPFDQKTILKEAVFERNNLQSTWTTADHARMEAIRNRADISQDEKSQLMREAWREIRAKSAPHHESEHGLAKAKPVSSAFLSNDRETILQSVHNKADQIAASKDGQKGIQRPSGSDTPLFVDRAHGYYTVDENGARKYLSEKQNETVAKILDSKNSTESIEYPGKRSEESAPAPRPDPALDVWAEKGPAIIEAYHALGGSKISHEEINTIAEDLSEKSGIHISPSIVENGLRDGGVEPVNEPYPPSAADSYVPDEKKPAAGAAGPASETPKPGATELYLTISSAGTPKLNTPGQ